MSAAGKTGVMAITADPPRSAVSSARSVLLQKKCACGGTAGGSSAECAACTKREREEKRAPLQRSAVAGSAAPATAPSSVTRALNSPGQRLDSGTRSFMESRFGRDLGGVRIHTDSQAADSARDVNAHAYTVGNHIVFDRGKYDPGSHNGRHLLAHELAHTVQQNGLQRSADGISVGEAPEYHRLESEADSVAHAVMAGSPAPAVSRPAQPLVSRAKNDEAPDSKKKKTAKSSAPTKDQTRDWEGVDPTSVLGQAGIKHRAVKGPDVSGEIQGFHLDPLELPPEKGNVLKLWQDVADRGALQAIVDTTGTIRMGLKQERPKTDELRKIWLQKVNWDPKDAETNWKKVAGNDSTFIPTVAGKSACQVDHILELQFGGSNVKENMQMLDGPENMQSGREIYQKLREKATAIIAALPDAQRPKYLLLYYETVTQSGAKCGPCCEAEAKVPALGAAGPGVGDKAIEVPIYAGGPPTSLFITGDYLSKKNKHKPVPIKDSEIPKNRSAATIVSGLLLDQLHQDHDIIDCVFDESPKSRVPVSLDKKSEVKLKRAKDGKLSLQNKHPNLHFHYPYLSEGVFKELNVEPDGSVSGRGSIRPSVSFLPPLDVKFDKDGFALVAPLDAKKMTGPVSRFIPGAKVTEADIGLQLAPEFKAYGAFAIEVSKPKKLLAARLDVSSAGTDVVAKGKLNAFLPGVDTAEGDITYQNREWSGGVKIEATQLQSKMKYVKSGSVTVGISGKGVSADGKVSLAIPHTEGIDVSLHYTENRWLFRGTGKIKPPRLEESEITILYDGTHLAGETKTGFRLFGIHGSIHVKYFDEKFSGEGDLEIKKGRVTGKMHVVMSQQQKFSGSGEVTIQVTESLAAKGGIEVDEHEKVRITGALEFTKPIPVFKAIEGDYEIFSLDTSIPIPGLSIPKIGGLNAKIKASLLAGYKIGPAELRNVKAIAAFNPLEDKPDVEFTLTGQFYMGVNGHVTGTLSGGLEISIAIASVSGGLGIAVTAALDGHILSDAKLHYKDGKLEAEAGFDLLLKLLFYLTICAWVHAEAGVWRLKVETTKVWKLKSFKYDTGLQLRIYLKKPVRYSSDQGMQLPSISDFEWVKPNVDAKDMLGRLFSAQDPPDSDDVDGEKECGR
ncbi:MAG: eCIS core domain-containing protein [Terriglobales bacterium]